jgi:hypothetical protein
MTAAVRLDSRPYKFQPVVTSVSFSPETAIRCLISSLSVRRADRAAGIVGEPPLS